MGRIQIPKIIQQGGGGGSSLDALVYFNGCEYPDQIYDNMDHIGSEIYTPGKPADMAVPLNGYDTSSYPLPIDSNFIYGPSTSSYDMAYNTFDQLGITHNSSNTYEWYIKLKLTSIPSVLRDICGIWAVCTPDIDTDAKIKMWNDGISSYSYESPVLTVGDWYYYKCRVTNGTDFECYLYDSTETLIDSYSFSDSGRTQWSNISSSTTVGWGNFPNSLTNTSGESTRIFDCGLIDLEESYFAVNGIKKQYFVPEIPHTIYYSDLQGGNN